MIVEMEPPIDNETAVADEADGMKSSASKNKHSFSDTSHNDDDDKKNERPTKKVKSKEYFLEIKWWADGDHSMFSDEIPSDGKFAESRAVQDNFKGENRELNLIMRLVDSKSEHRQILVEMDVFYWTVPTNLMHFHQLSQDLASFGRALWKAAGEPEEDYCDMAIEFGDSAQSSVEISGLVETAAEIEGKEHVLYIKSVTMNPASSFVDSKKFLNMIFTTCPAIILAHKVDLKDLYTDQGSHEDIGFEQIDRYSFVGPSLNYHIESK
jgi:hypothetical protein